MMICNYCGSEKYDIIARYTRDNANIVTGRSYENHI